MRTVYRYTILLFLVFISWKESFGQTAPFANIGNAMRSGDISGITNYIDNTVDITINNNQSTYSKAQAEMVLRDFFAKHPPSEFSVEQNGNNNGNLYSIGHLSTGHCRYRVYVLMRPKEGNYFLQELRFEK